MATLIQRVVHAFEGTDPECEDVRQMHQKFGFIEHEEPGHITKRLLGERLLCLSEELAELAMAGEEQDLEKMADALIDLVYFAKGTAIMMGLPWVQLWNDVQRANMGKVRGVGHRGHKVDLIKPVNWSPPQGLHILWQHGYIRDEWSNDSTDLVIEEDCRDYA